MMTAAQAASTLMQCYLNRMPRKVKVAVFAAHDLDHETPLTTAHATLLPQYIGEGCYGRGTTAQAVSRRHRRTSACESEPTSFNDTWAFVSAKCTADVETTVPTREACLVEQVRAYALEHVAVAGSADIIW